MMTFLLSSCLLLHLMVSPSSTVETSHSPLPETSNNAGISDRKIENYQEQKNVDPTRETPVVLGKRKRKQLARQNKRATTYTKGEREKILSEIKNIIEQILTDGDTYLFFVQIIEQFAGIVEAQTALKSVHWFQNEMNRYLIGPKSSSVKTDFENIFNAYISSDAGGEPTVDDSTYMTEFFYNVNDVIVTLVPTPNVERMIRNEFDRITKLLSTA